MAVIRPRMMNAMLLRKPGAALETVEVEVPEPGPGQVQVRVSTCGVCRTDLHVLDGELPQARYPIIPGHQVVGRVTRLGCGVFGLRLGQRVGIPWLGHTCGHCEFCTGNHENLCREALFTGCHVNGGFADYCVADHRFCFPLPCDYDDLQVAPLLCAGLIGYRAYAMCADATDIGFMGFGASAHILAQLAVSQGRTVHAFTRPGDTAAQDFAMRLGAEWAGGADATPPRLLDAVIIFAASGELVPRALSLVKPGGRVICAGIHMSTIPAFDYDLLWEERSLVSVANLTRRDAREFLALATQHHIHTEVHRYPLADANLALQDLREGRFTGAAVLVCEGSQSCASGTARAG